MNNPSVLPRFSPILLLWSVVVSAAPEPIEEILVVGARLPRPVQDVVGTVDVVTREALMTQIALDTRDAVRYLPGVSVTEPSGRFGVTELTIRGLSGNRVTTLVDTLEPLKIVSTRGMTVDTQEYHPEPRVAAIVASHQHPEFIVNVTETGLIKLVNYENRQPDGNDHRCRPLPARRWPGPDPALLPHGREPVRQGRGGGFARPGAGSAGGGHLGPASRPRGEPDRSGARAGVGDERPRQRRDHVHRHRSRGPSGTCREGRARARGPGRRLAVRQDAPEVAQPLGGCALNPDESISQSVAVFDVDDPAAGYQVLPIAEWAGIEEGPRRVVHREYNKAGTEVWFSVWNALDQASAIVVVNDATRELEAVIKDPRLITPTGKFNIYNTTHEVY